MKKPKAGEYVQNIKGVIFKVLKDDISTIKAYPENYRRSTEEAYFNQQINGYFNHLEPEFVEPHKI